MSRQHILVADDDRQLALALSLRLSSVGYDVTTATDGYNALARTVEQHPDLLILDINMPAGDGFSVHERLAKASPPVSVPIIYITGNASDEMKAAAAAAEAVALVEKPINMPTLLAQVRKALASRAA